MRASRSVLWSLLACTMLVGIAACQPPTPAGLGKSAKKERRAADVDDADEDEDEVEGDEDGEPHDGPTRIGSALVVDLGPVEQGRDVVLDVPDNALGFNVVVRSEGAGNVGIQKIVTPSGTVLLDAFTPKNGGGPIGEGYDGIASVTIPQNDIPEALEVPAGKWTIVFAGEGTNARAEVRVQTSSDGRFHGGVLDLHVHIPAGLKMSGGVVSAGTAPQNGAMKARLDVFFQTLASRFGIDRGEVTFHAAPAALTAVDDYDRTYLEAAAVTKGVPDGQAVHLILTNSLHGGENLGFSTGIPGAATRFGTPMSAVFAALYDDIDDPNVDGLTWLHEVGHFAGLFHTSEFDGTLFDPLNDTPRCPGTTQSCPDSGNLMATKGGIAQALVTAGQKAVFRGSPLYRAYTSTSAVASSAAARRSLPVRPEPSITRSGRPLTAVERWIGSTLCGTRSPLGLVKERGLAAARADLQAVTVDFDLPRVYRVKAARMLDRLDAGE